MPGFDYFNLIAPLYERFSVIPYPKKLIETAELPSKGILLDAGGGTGRIAQALRGYVDSIVIADLSIGMLRRASRKNNLHLICSQSEKLPFPTETFQRVIMVDAFHHVIHQSKTGKELWRVLSPGGILVIQEPDIQTGVVKFIAVMEKLALMRSHFLTPERIVDYFLFPNAVTRIEREGAIAWVIVNKY